ncbi:pilus assembly protein [Arthrobacter sp. EH-1B-1]|uniref:Pilus assembly protein n=1 Tax=Arthrobacter vasquezii TaxID=2977629 RepID=A0ABT6CYU0_9MICC|nr:pilus assembly protein [Arthrobacter vasquezii]
MNSQRERGAIAVEMGILLPVLILLLLGIMEFGRAFNAQITLTSAAREGVRVMAITNDPVKAKAAASAAGSTLEPTLTNGDFSPAPTPCNPTVTGENTTFTISYTLNTLTGIAGPFTMTGRGTMLCGG